MVLYIYIVICIHVIYMCVYVQYRYVIVICNFLFYYMYSGLMILCVCWCVLIIFYFCWCGLSLVFALRLDISNKSCAAGLFNVWKICVCLMRFWAAYCTYICIYYILYIVGDFVKNVNARARVRNFCRGNFCLLI